MRKDPLAAGIPLSTPVPALKVTPEGRGPDSDSVGTGYPVVATVNEPAAPNVNLVVFELVMVAPWSIAKLTAAEDPPPGAGLMTTTGSVRTVA